MEVGKWGHRLDYQPANQMSGHTTSKVRFLSDYDS